MKDSDIDVVAAPRQKLDPETLVIRARPRPAVRFKRSVIVGLAAAGAGGLTLVCWSAMRDHGMPTTSDMSELSQPGAARREALSALPVDYAAVPKLGPPLPGDLGRPILERQAALNDAPVQEGKMANGQAIEAEQERQVTEAKAARGSPLLVHASELLQASGAPKAGLSPENPAVGSRSLVDPSDTNAQQRKLDFVAANDGDASINPHEVMGTPSPYLLSAGSVIAASLITGLRSDLPGIVSAQVTTNVFDSPTGHILLVPQGARLIGSYDSVVAFGQKRALVVWQRIVFPDGSSLSLDNAPATDPSGYSGLADKVDFHTWALLKGVAISTLLGVSAQLQFSGGNDLVEAVRQSTQQSVSRAGDQLTSKALDIQPTITVRPGAPVRLVVHHDLVLRPWKDR